MSKSSDSRLEHFSKRIISFDVLTVFSFALIFLVYFLGLFVDVMEVDAAQYASISMEMSQTGNWFQVLHRGNPYLDKPPLLFWLSALSFKCFGLSNFAYKLPSFLFTILGVWATYKLGVKLFSKQTGKVAALLLFGCQAWYSFNNDIRTDTLLANSVIMAVWLFYEYLHSSKIFYYLGVFLFVALAMLAKGPLGFMVPVLTIGSYLFYKRDFRNLFTWRWLPGLLFLGLLLSPMVYGLYKQYGSEGPLFYFWTQSFGRLTGQSVWKNDLGYFFFVHTFLWAFLPFSLLTCLSWTKGVFVLLKDKFSATHSNLALPLAGFTLPFIALSVSSYKLPHYIFVVMPFAALITAPFILGLNKSQERLIHYLNLILMVLMMAIIVLICIWIFPLTSAFIWIGIILLFAAVNFVFIKSEGAAKVIFPSLISLAVLNFVANTHLFPKLLKYSSGSTMSDYVKEENIPLENLRFLNRPGYSFEFYVGMLVPDIDADSVRSGMWIVTNEDGLNEIKARKIPIDRLQHFDNFRISMLTWKFLNPKTREQTLQKHYILRVL